MGLPAYLNQGEPFAFLWVAVPPPSLQCQHSRTAAGSSCGFFVSHTFTPSSFNAVNCLGFMDRTAYPLHGLVSGMFYRCGRVPPDPLNGQTQQVLIGFLSAELDLAQILLALSSLRLPSLLHNRAVLPYIRREHNTGAAVPIGPDPAPR